MGMDCYIFRARTKAAFDSDDWYNNKDIVEVWYARRFWDLVYAMPFIQRERNDDDDDEDDVLIKLTKDNIEEMLQFATHNRDYWDSFDSVPKLCEILDTFDEYEEQGQHFYFYLSE